MPELTDESVPWRPGRRKVPRTLLAALVAAGVVTGGVACSNADTATDGDGGPTPAAAPPGPGQAPADPGRGGPGPGPEPGPPGDPAHDADGRITAVDGSTLTVTDDFGRARTFELGSDSRIHRGPDQQVAADALRVGDHVHVRAPADGGDTPQAQDVDVLLPHVDGVVADVAGATLTITDHDGFRRAVTTSDQTRYRDDGNDAAAADVQVGTVVHAEGTVDADGTTLVATSIDLRR